MSPDAALAGLATQVLGHGFLAFLRIGAVVFFLPMFGSALVSMRIKLGLALGLSLIVMPLAGETVSVPDSASGYMAAAGSEVFTGLLFGFAVRSVFWAIQIAGAISAQSISLTQILGNQIEQPIPALGQIIFVAALALAAALDFHTIMVVSLARSFDLVPLGTPVPVQLVEVWSVQALARLFELAFALSGPFIILAVLYNLCLGVVNKAMPQLMVAFVGAPAITWLGMVALFLAGPVILAAWSGHVLSLPFVWEPR